MKVVFDSVILIDALNGLEPARNELRKHSDVLLSTVSWVEVLAGARDESDRQHLREFLEQWPEAPLDAQIATQAAELRQAFGLRLADAVIFATAQQSGRVLVTRNTKDFKPPMPGIRIPYKI